MNDFTDRNGRIAGVGSWANSWIAASNMDNCPDPPDVTDPCAEVSREQRNWAQQYCARFKQEPFKSSCPLDVTPAYKVRDAGFLYKIVRLDQLLPQWLEIFNKSQQHMINDQKLDPRSTRCQAKNSVNPELCRERDSLKGL